MLCEFLKQLSLDLMNPFATQTIGLPDFFKGEGIRLAAPAVAIHIILQI